MKRKRLRREVVVNHKRLFRIYHEERLMVGILAIAQLDWNEFLYCGEGKQPQCAEKATVSSRPLCPAH